ncbi:MAG: AEC family transporter [Trueperaceae bacterium]|nr:AEC family transporter [Trueperaceae bacterium]
MSLVASALVPLTVLIVLGIALKRSRFLPDTFWPGLDRLNYWVFFPSLIFVSLATTEGGLAGSGPVALSVWGGLGLVAIAALALRTRLAADGPAFTSVFQGSIRFNSYVAFIVLPVLYPGSEGLTALLVALTVPVVNVLCVSVLARHGAGAALRWRTLLGSIVTNPLIVASVLGVIMGRLDVPLGPLASSLQMLGQAALAAGLLSVGATLRFRNVRSGWRQVLASMALKFAGLPLATWAVASLLGVRPELLGPLLLFQAMPTASASYVLARAMRGDERLMAAILAVHTLAALAWLPVVAWWARIVA